MTDVTQILSEIERADPAAKRLLPLVYDAPRQVAVAKLANEKPGQTLQATALVHAAYPRLVDAEKIRDWNSRGHFFMAATWQCKTVGAPRSRKGIGGQVG